MTTSNLDVTKFLAEITGLSVPATAGPDSPLTPAADGLCPCGQPKMKGDRAVYCDLHSRQGNLVYKYLPAEHRNWKQALVDRNPGTHAAIEAKLHTAMGGKEAYTQAMNAPRPAFRSPRKVTAATPPPSLAAVTPGTTASQAHAGTLIAKVDAAITLLAEVRQELAVIRNTK